MQIFTISLILASAGACRSAILQRTVSEPLIQQDFPDPSPIYSNGSWYVFASQSSFIKGGPRVQVAKSTDLSFWQVLQDYDALYGLPPTTIDTNEVWAPSVVELSDHSFLLYFSTSPAEDRSKKCIYTARSQNVIGPYLPDHDALDCSLSQGGSLDLSGFVDTDGKRYVTWKMDGNAIGNGGSCGNGVPPLVDTPLMLQQVGDDGVSKIGPSTVILRRDDIDGPTIEAPQLIKRDGLYVLFFSNNCFDSPLYTQSYAYSRDIRGPYRKAARPLYTLGDYGLAGPGGGEVIGDGSKIVFHALQETGLRYMHVGSLQYNLDGFGEDSVQILG
ncbi:Hypothetical protein D9617_50g044320 [Elsinoe fawcettii]|nr:Hypothetical protein D9617_50g044320 [Elsinoe fawcettii]